MSGTPFPENQPWSCRNCGRATTLDTLAYRCRVVTGGHYLVAFTCPHCQTPNRQRGVVQIDFWRVSGLVPLFREDEWSRGEA